MKIDMKEIVAGAVYGLAVGDCLGVPWEFSCEQERVFGMCDGGKHGQPAGTWSDDTALSLATLDALTFPFDIQSMSKNFVACCFDNRFWQEELFDIGSVTYSSVQKIKADFEKQSFSSIKEYGWGNEKSNGNGSLMRMIPVILYLQAHKDVYDSFEKRQELVYRISGLTHAHITAKVGCRILCEYGLLLIRLQESFTLKKRQKIAYKKVCHLFHEQWTEDMLPYSELLSGKFLNFFNIKMPVADSYVVNSLSASIWALSESDNYEQAVLTAVNLGDDTDTTACITGGLAGILYGIKSIPCHWIKAMRKKEILENTITKFRKNNNLLFSEQPENILQ